MAFCETGILIKFKAPKVCLFHCDLGDPSRTPFWKLQRMLRNRGTLGADKK